MQTSNNEIFENLPTTFCHLAEDENSIIPQLRLGIKEYDKRIIEKIAQGFKVKEIAEMFDKSYHTISSMVEDLREKLTAKNTAQLVAIFMSLNLIKYEPFIPPPKKEDKRPPAVYSNRSYLNAVK